MTKEVLTDWMSSAQRLAGLKAYGGMHILRYDQELWMKG